MSLLELNAVLNLLDRIIKCLKYIFHRLPEKKPSLNSVPRRFVLLFENHGVHRNQIPRFFDHGLTLADMSSDDNLLAKLTPDILKAASELFACGLNGWKAWTTKSRRSMIFISNRKPIDNF